MWILYLNCTLNLACLLLWHDSRLLTLVRESAWDDKKLLHCISNAVLTAREVIQLFFKKGYSDNMTFKM